MKADAFDRFLFASGQLIGSGDLDPLYPYLRTLLSRLRPDLDDRLWFVQLYQAFYRVDTAWSVFTALPHRGDWKPGCLDLLGPLPIATERRNLRSRPRLEEHLGELVTADLGWWIARGARTWPVEWKRLYDATMELKHNGPWAAFKWTDLARYVLSWNLTPTPMTVAAGSGPAAGLKMLDCTLDELNLALANQGFSIPWDQIETCLCKWHGIETGHYRLGQDLEELSHHVQGYRELKEAHVRTDFPLPLPARNRAPV